MLGDEVLVGDEVRVGRNDAADALALHHGRGRDPGRGRPRRRRSRAAAGPAAASAAASPDDFDVAVVANAVASPATPLTRSCSAWTIAWFSSRSGPGGFSFCAAATFCRSCSAIPESFAVRLATFVPGRRQRVRDRCAVGLGAVGDRGDLRHVVLVAGVLGRRRRRTGSRARRTRAPRRGRRSARAGAGAASARVAVLPGGACRSPAAAAGQAHPARRCSLLGRGRLVFEEVELDIVVAGVHAQGESTAFVRSAKEMSWQHRRNEGVLGCARARPLPRPLPAAATAGRRRDGPRLARPGRAERPRRRTEDRRPRGQVGAPGRARGARGRLAAPSALPADRLAGAGPVPRLHHLRVHPGPHAPRGDARGRARRPERRSRSRRRSPRRSRTPTARASSTATSSRRTSCSPSTRLGAGRGRRAAARLRPGPDGRVRHADRARRHPRHARLHLARAPAGADGHDRRRRLGRRRAALGGTGRASIRSGAATWSRPRGGSSRAPTRSHGYGPTCPSTCWRRSGTRCSSTRSAVPRPSGWPHELRSLPKRHRSKHGGSTPAAPARSLSAVASERLVPAALTGLASGWVAAALPFYPAGWPARDRRSGSRARLRRAAPRPALRAHGRVLPARQHLRSASRSSMPPSPLSGSP